jgi:predicted RNase H-like HicB family nuclease
MKVTAYVTRSDGWWAVEVPEVPGLFTQARTLDQVPAMVIDAVALMTGVPEASVIVTVARGTRSSGGT